MLPKKRRIERKEFPGILSSGRRFHSPNFLLYILKTDGEDSSPSRFSFSVSKKVQKNATTRNTYRRRGYSVIKNHLEFIKPGYICFFSFKKSADKPTFAILDKEIIHLLREVGVLS
jgi:ribonuclease P protein component